MPRPRADDRKTVPDHVVAPADHRIEHGRSAMGGALGAPVGLLIATPGNGRSDSATARMEDRGRTTHELP
ncbi:hypothetical protein, partial [Nocardia carnea]|uniref:hypothetical protein n=1 Tax=Nocardia carnea TaxID=37328 RepID=UPI003D7798A2